ncbi:uncharacterized protein (DUF983 family) [Rhodobium orientis]|uniref:DUF983 domain-containing protein n=1 Tax=Rhodobium orientis TaxID=34017 RepID=A0A327JP44_9HYPH|nr:DUF983 domain-containing protein [Rhodobium orientis]MBB4304223.1 uncharacterized protein (DUF983 family) [Rhodobium orientis]MBK5950692.1 hypothetical protein [Rhodobium orientis]RAI28067.1 hypothetical protein CH339_08200 [Rhodobium orientis]
MSDEHFPAHPPFVTGLRGRCPRCASASMFDGFLEIHETCPSCGLDYEFVDSADAPAVFASFIVGFIVVGLALAVEVAYRPPIWLHMVLWLPLVVILGLGCLRPLKGIFIALQYHHKARQGELG